MIVALSCLGACADEAVHAQDALEQLKLEVHQDYPDVRHVSLQELDAGLDDALLVDVRDDREFSMSHIPGAVHANTLEQQLRLAAQNPDRLLILYCSVGVRSSRAVRRLQRHGVNAANLDGSIFEWANRGRPLVNDHGPTDEVHDYSFRWRRYLNRPPTDTERPTPPQAAH